MYHNGTILTFSILICICFDAVQPWISLEGYLAEVVIQSFQPMKEDVAFVPVLQTRTQHGKLIKKIRFFCGGMYLFLGWHWLQRAETEHNGALTKGVRQCRHLWLLASFACLCDCLRGYCGFSGLPLTCLLLGPGGTSVKQLCRDSNAKRSALITYMCELADATFACRKQRNCGKTNRDA